MKIASLTVGLVLAAGFIVAAGAPHARAAENPCAKTLSKWQRTECMEMHVSAPGDQYFGRMKMSYLGINNTFRDDSIRAGANTTDKGVISSVSWADEALRAWAKAYPNDPELARSYFLAVQVMSKIYVKLEQERAYHYMLILVHHFPKTYFGKVMSASLARGFTEHWYATAQPCGVTAPGATPSAAPSATPSPIGVHVEILPTACIPPPTPTPSASPSTSASPAPSSSPTPSS